MSDQITKFLKAEAPWFTDMDCNLSALGNSVDLHADVNRYGAAFGLQGFGNASRLLANREYLAELREVIDLSDADVEDSIATRKAVFEAKKRADEAAETVSLRKLLRDDKFGSKVVTAQGERRTLDSLTLPELRKAKADIQNHLRMKGMSAGDLRAENAAKFPAPVRRADGFPPMPKSVVLPAGLRIGGEHVSNGYTAVDLTPDVITHLARSKSDSPEFFYFRFRLTRMYGIGQTNDRMQQPVGAGEEQ
jgi:hypothetical protein